MKITLNGIEIEFPAGATIDVSADGKKVKVSLPETEVVEKIRVVEVPGPERVIERIRVVETEVEKPCTRPHYPTYPTNPNPWITWTTTQPNTSPNWTTAGDNILRDGHTVTCDPLSGTVTTSSSGVASGGELNGYVYVDNSGIGGGIPSN